MKINNASVLFALILLTVGSYFFSEESGASGNLAFLILFVLLKVLLVVIYFMELKVAHLAWLAVLSLILIVYAGFVFSLN